MRNKLAKQMRRIIRAFCKDMPPVAYDVEALTKPYLVMGSNGLPDVRTATIEVKTLSPNCQRAHYQGMKRAIKQRKRGGL